AASLPRIGDNDGELRAFAIRIGDVARDPGERLPAFLVDADRDERELAVVVDLREAREHRRRELGELIEEAEVAGAIGQPVDARTHDVGGEGDGAELERAHPGSAQTSVDTCFSVAAIASRASSPSLVAPGRGD